MFIDEHACWFNFNPCTLVFIDQLTLGCDIFEEGKSTPIADSGGILNLTSVCLHTFCGSADT